MLTSESAGNTGVVVVRAVDQEVVVSFTLPVNSESSEIGALGTWRKQRELVGIARY